MSRPTKRMALTAALAVLAVAGMTGLAFSAVPLYRMFCQATGYGGTTQTASTAPSAVLARSIEVRFDANVATDLPVEFTPSQLSETLHLGETGLAFYRIRNTSDQPVTMVATYNVAPHQIGLYFQKLECFCFQEQTLAAGAEAELPVIYFIDPELANDPNLREAGSVTLSYTFFRTTEEAAAALSQ